MANQAPAARKMVFCLSVLLLPVVSAKCTEDAENRVKPLAVGGTPAAPCRYPYMVSLTRPLFEVHVCGGTLVHPSWILTAASCVDSRRGQAANPVAFINGVLLGSPDSFEERIQTDQHAMRIHPNYTTELEGYNVALLKLFSPSNQTVVKLIIPGDELTPGEDLTLLGWGRMGGGGGFSPDLMEVAEAEVQEPQDCINFGAQDPAKVWCVGEGDGGFCQGDEGGPVVRQGINASMDVQVGIAASNEACGILGRPSLLTGLSHVIEWISAIVNESE